MNYTIKSGDTLYSIAGHYGISLTQLLAANPGLTSSSVIHVGQNIVVPGAFVPNPPPASISTHLVRSGDTLYGIASDYGISLNQLLAANPGLSTSSTIQVGQAIMIPGSGISIPQPSNAGGLSTHIVASGDTLYGIASRYGISLDKLLAANPSLTAGSIIHVGQAIIIPTTIVASGALKRFSRTKFFSAYRLQFGAVSYNQETGLDFLLDSFEQDSSVGAYINYMAYLLATVKHETANTFQPIGERGSLSYFDKYDPVLAPTFELRSRALSMGNTQRGDGYKYRGRGYVQVTWKINYQKFSSITGHDLVRYPDDALDRRVAYKIMSYGMVNGSFTEHKLSQYISAQQADYYQARQVVNGYDQADLIASYAEKFQHILSAAVI